MRKITLKQAERLMRKYLKHRPDKIAHSLHVSKFAYQLGKKIRKKHPEIKINLKEVRILGLLHDVGLHETDWIYHTFAGGKILRKLGLDYYARKVESHGPSHELSSLFKLKGDFLPRTIEEKLLIYADSHIQKDRFVKPSERFSDNLGLKKIKEKWPKALPSIKKSISRRKKIIQEINSLIK